jgi:hypothetical protein
MPVGLSASRSAIQSDTLSLGLKHPKTSQFVVISRQSGSGLTRLNPTIALIKQPHFASFAALAVFVIFDFPQEIIRKPSAYHIDSILIRSYAKHAMVQLKVRTNMQENNITMRINQQVSDYLTPSREKGWKLVNDQPKLAIKHLLSVDKTEQLKEVFENYLQLDKISLRTDLYGFVNLFSMTAVDADR